MLPSVLSSTSASRSKSFSRLNGWPMRSPVNASPTSSQMPPHDSGASVVRCTFTARDFHSLLFAGFAGALITDFITNACFPPVEPTDGRGAGGKGRGARSRNGESDQGLSVQEASQRLTSVVLGLLGHAGIHRAIEAVIRPRIHVQLDRYSGTAQSIRIAQVFFKEEIEPANRNVGWRQARHIRR